MEKIEYVCHNGYPKEAFDFVCDVYMNNINCEKFKLNDSHDQWHKWSYLNDEPYISRIITIMAKDSSTREIIGVLLTGSTTSDEKMLAILSEEQEQFLFKKLPSSKCIVSISKAAVDPKHQRQGITKKMTQSAIFNWNELNRPVGIIITCVNKSNIPSLKLHKDFEILSQDEHNIRFYCVLDEKK